MLGKDEGRRVLRLRAFDSQSSRFSDVDILADAIQGSKGRAPAYPVIVGALGVGTAFGLLAAGLAGNDGVDQPGPLVIGLGGFTFGALAGGVAGALSSSAVASHQEIGCRAAGD